MFRRLVDATIPGEQSPIDGVAGSADVPLIKALVFAARKSADFQHSLDDECMTAENLAASALVIAEAHGTEALTLLPDIDQRAAIVAYTMESPLYGCVNAACRSNDRTKVKPYFPYLKLLHAALARLQPIERIVYRGVKEDLRTGYTLGSTFTWWQLSSCTTNVGVLATPEFLGESGPRTHFMIETSSSRPIHMFSSVEDEVMLMC